MLLLDSQALLWALAKARRPGPHARAEVTSGVPVHVSAATVLELTIKAMLGKLQAPAELSERITQRGFDLLSVTAEHAKASVSSQSWYGTIPLTGSLSLRPARRVCA